jgi:hypothetical protein
MFLCAVSLSELAMVFILRAVAGRNFMTVTLQLQRNPFNTPLGTSTCLTRSLSTLRLPTVNW